MKIAKQSPVKRRIGYGAAAPAHLDNVLSAATSSGPAMVASAFDRLDSKRRARLLSRLLGSVGPLALAVIGGGVFAKFLPSARLPVMPVSFEDAALATSSQVYELVRYVEQSNPNLLDGVLTALLQDGVAVTAFGASIAAIAIRQISDRSSTPATPRSGP